HSQSASTTSTPSSWGSVRELTGLGLSSLLAVYAFISLAAVLYAFYFIRELLPQRQGGAEKQPLCHGDVESGYADEKSMAKREKASDLSSVIGTGTPQVSRPPTDV